MEMFDTLESLRDSEWGKEVTPVEKHGDNWVKRDDTFSRAGVRGGKVRSAWFLCTKDGTPRGLCTAGARTSPQIKIIGSMAKELGVPMRAHTTQGALGPEVEFAKNLGADIIQHKAGYNNVLIARAREDAESLGYLNIPFGMECIEAIHMTALQVANIPQEVSRIVMPVGSAMSFMGVLWGLELFERNIEVLGVRVGADPTKRLEKYAPPGWESFASVEQSSYAYKDYFPDTHLSSGLEIDPIYEAKCLPYLEPDDLFWVVGIR